MIPDGYVPPLRNTEDIPIQRSVTAMGMNDPAQPEFKPYVYRGWNIDLFEDLPPILRPAPPPPPPKPKRTWTHEQRVAARDRRIAKRDEEIAGQAARNNIAKAARRKIRRERANRP